LLQLLGQMASIKQAEMASIKQVRQVEVVALQETLAGTLGCTQERLLL